MYINENGICEEDNEGKIKFKTLFKTNVNKELKGKLIKNGMFKDTMEYIAE